MAGESALIAMSTRMRIAYLGSCSKVRSEPRLTSRRSLRSASGPSPAVDAHERHAVDDRVADRPRHLDDRARAARRARRGAATSIAWITAGPPRWTSSWLTARQLLAPRRPSRPAALGLLEQRRSPARSRPAPGRRHTRGRARSGASRACSTSSTKNTTLTSSSAIATQSVSGGTLPVPPRSTQTMAASE